VTKPERDLQFSRSNKPQDYVTPPAELVVAGGCLFYGHKFYGHNLWPQIYGTIYATISNSAPLVVTSCCFLEPKKKPAKWPAFLDNYGEEDSGTLEGVAPYTQHFPVLAPRPLATSPSQTKATGNFSIQAF